MGSYSNTWTTPGSYSLTLPYGVTITTAYCWAGGGRGGKVVSTQGRLGGGGGGSFAKPSNPDLYNNEGGALVEIVVGTGGSDSGINGGNSKITVTVAGGKSGTVWVEAGGGVGVADNSTSAGSAGTVVTGSGNSGGAGAAGTSTYSGGAGGGAGSSGAGTSASGKSGGAGGPGGGGAGGDGLTSSANGNSGTQAGGGGSGAYQIGTDSTRSGGPGAAGQVLLEFTWPDNVLLNLVDAMYDKVAVSTKTLNVTVLLEGFYAGSGTMVKCQDDFGDHFPGTTTDQITIELRNGTTYAQVYTAVDVNLSTSGSASIQVPAQYNGSYYVNIITRNHIETCSANPLSFAGSTINYDFTTAASQAYGDNQQTLSGGYYGLFAGDVNQDLLVDSTDVSIVDDAATNFITGYVETDINGDGLVDSTDVSITDANSSNFIGAILPWI